MYYVYPVISQGTEVAAVRATDLDSGVNSELKYSIQKGALDSFAIDNETGVVTVSSKLDYDKRNTYRIQIIATDFGKSSFSSCFYILRPVYIRLGQYMITPICDYANI